MTLDDATFDGSTRDGSKLDVSSCGFEPDAPPRMVLDRYATPDGRARFHLVRPRLAAEQSDEDDPSVLTLTNAVADSVSHIPELKTCAVRFERCVAPPDHQSDAVGMALRQ